MGSSIGNATGGMSSVATAIQQQELDMTSAETTMANTQIQKDKMRQQVQNNRTNFLVEQSQYNAKVGDKINLSH
ncbi:hypothetical protein SAMN05216359_10237 [Roseateles sp. YR242]|uniref:hypothetical protein n=1 Tax=Roseateles sp. YR242 TaxID=1855305 RepID=UPI0008B4849D|nr:hypothetical protein [Roseateles sp. YR242]SEK51188.1 hypothetical protein SAMN05216359_10237 [Roseateles sp. YR242]